MAEACTAVEPLLSAWLDGELDGREAERMASHLAACDGCTELLDDLAAVASMLGNLPVRRAPADLPCARPGATGAPRSALRRAQALAVATGLLVAAAFALGAGEVDQQPVPAPLDAFVADRPGEVLRGQVTTPVILDTSP